MPILSIRDARKSFGRVRALHGVSLDLYAGELLGFLGPNGAGKTTLIRCLSGRAKLDGGTFWFHEGIRKPGSMGMVPQSIAVYDDLTTEQNLFAFGKLHSVRRAQLPERVREVLSWSNLGDRRSHLVRTLSGGMKRRLNIACSVLHRPEILLLDEPTVGVDPQSRERIYEMLDDLRQQGASILLATHQLEEAQSRCDRIAIVDQGKIVQLGTFDQLVAATVGRRQRLTVTFRSVPVGNVDPLALDAAGTTGSCLISDVAKEFPQLMATLLASRERIENLLLQRPTLQDVFLHLTGKELRE